MGLALDDQGFHYSSFSRFRSRLAEHGLERYAFDKLVRLAIETGLLVKDAEQVLDSTPIHGAAALQDTYTLQTLLCTCDTQRRTQTAIGHGRGPPSAAGIKGASVHTLRHTFASHHVAQGTSLRTVQEMLGHADLKTTSIYVQLAQEVVRKEVQEHAL